MKRVIPHFFFVVATLLAGASLLGPTPAWSQYPTKTIRIIVGWPAGGPTDTIARIIAQRLSDSLKQPVIVDNRPGALGGIGSETAARSDSHDVWGHRFGLAPYPNRKNQCNRG